MTQVPTPALNQGQQAAADGFFQFLFSPDKELIISGAGGHGKTFLMGHLIDKIMPNYHATCKLMGIPAEYEEITMTAMTNKAAEVLARATGRPTSTIHSFMNLKVSDDYDTGRSLLTKTNNWVVHERKIIFIDECSMIDWPLLEMIREGTHKCKIIYVGDHSQLAPIMEPISPIYRMNFPFFELTEPMRNKNQPALMDLCQQLRDTVATGVFNPIRPVPGIIDHLDGPMMEREIQAVFSQGPVDARILAYTNNQVMAYNDHIRSIRQLHSTYTVGELMINNSAVIFRKGIISVEEEVEIVSLEPTTQQIEIDDDVFLEVRMATLKNKFGELYEGMPLPENKEHYRQLIKYMQGIGKKTRRWRPYFDLKNKYPDLRPRDAATVHKSQGSTYDTVYVDLENLSTCRNPDLAARLLYVAFTRAQNRIVLYGDLAPKYGGVIH